MDTRGKPMPAQPEPNPASGMDPKKFFELVRKSQLVGPEKLKQAIARMPQFERARQAARWFVENRILTKFQAERLLGGKWDGFIIGQYRILEEIGRGGMGRVYKAEQIMMGRVVALKILSSALTKTSKARELFDREVRAAAQLNHPNIVSAFDANEISGRCFLVMEFVDGPNLQDLVRTKGALPITQACEFMRQAALGLQAAHDVGMVHRDIKPANLLVMKNTGRSTESQYTIKILDFGLARLSANVEVPEGMAETIATSKGTVMGTPDYLSPEQARSMHDAHHASDLYSLGCTFFCLLTGRVPYPGGNALDKMLRHTTEETPSVRELRPDVPVEVEAVVHQLMAKNPEDRFESARQLADVLDNIMEDEDNSWIVIDTLPVDTDLAAVSMIQRPSSSRLQPVSDPWTNLSSRQPSLDSSPTLQGQSARTKVTSSITQRISFSSGLLPRIKAASRSWAIGLSVLISLILLVAFWLILRSAV
jgi:eukaryotic-like serine/threonine-protein kinase